MNQALLNVPAVDVTGALARPANPVRRAHVSLLAGAYVLRVVYVPRSVPTALVTMEQYRAAHYALPRPADAGELDCVAYRIVPGTTRVSALPAAAVAAHHLPSPHALLLSELVRAGETGVDAQHRGGAAARLRAAPGRTALVLCFADTDARRTFLLHVRPRVRPTADAQRFRAMLAELYASSGSYRFHHGVADGRAAAATSTEHASHHAPGPAGPTPAGGARVNEPESGIELAHVAPSGTP
jgi:hypothetical protein